MRIESIARIRKIFFKNRPTLKNLNAFSRYFVKEDRCQQQVNIQGSRASSFKPLKIVAGRFEKILRSKWLTQRYYK